ncbi:MAG TPA: tetratricopeptide repeat protein [Candidatus Kapabacteria bacterium]|nr:tetratricopeptide repeat protein [Candidatus Kapabacteria bacterium]
MRAIASGVVMLTFILTLAACSSGSETTREETPKDSTATTAATPPADTTSPKHEETLGEQLGRLDARMKTAPADSLPALQAKYDSLLANVTSGGNIKTGGRDWTNSADLDSINVTTGPRSHGGTDSSGLMGFRTSELDTAAHTAPTAPAPHYSHRITYLRAAPAPEELAKPAPDSARRRERSYVDGLVAARSGKYEDAVRQLPAVIAKPPKGRAGIVRSAYAESLEKTGSTAKATDEYRKASAGSDEVANKSYLSYCRLLAKSGDRTRARQLLSQFIARHPRSPQVVNARQLLQTL